MVREDVRPVETVEILSDTETIEENTYSVILYNDSITPVEVVFLMLVEVFAYNPDNAIKKIIETEKTGKARVKSGCTFGQASEWIQKSSDFSKEYGFEIQMTIEEE